MSAQSDRAARAREERLKRIEEQIENGSLVIRQMTPAERKANPPQPRRTRPVTRRW
jgi:hypothetical protein